MTIGGKRMDFRKLFRSLVVLVVLIAVVVLTIYLYRASLMMIHLQPGWQKIVLNGTIPSGAVAVVDEDAYTFMPNNDPETKRKSGFVRQGRINFVDQFWVVTQTEVWVYYPEPYEFCVDLGLFNDECLNRLSELTGKEETSIKEFIFGH